MRHSYLLYRAILPQADEVRPCCTDEPEVRGISKTTPALVRWPRKVRHAAPLSLHVFRRSIAQPIRDNRRGVPAIGTRVVTPTGDPVGRVREVLIGLSTGEPTLAIEPDAQGRKSSKVMILLPGHAVTSGKNGTVVMHAANGRVA
jgi:hypothetical protein